jgi:dTDP-glucose pyrophosphorylase
VQAVILAAGRGTRLHPITLNRTKAMCPIVGKPIVERVMDTMVTNGIRDFVLVISPDDPEIQSYFANQSTLDANIQFVPQLERKGMGHALLQASPLIHADFILSSCDNLVADDQIAALLTTWEQEQPNGILSTLRVGPEEIVRMGIVELDGDRIVRIVEKPSLEKAPSDIGSVPLYMFSGKMQAYLPLIPKSPRGEYELQDAIQMLIDRDGKVRQFQLPSRIDLTTPADLLALNIHFLPKNQDKIEIQQGILGKNTRFRKPVIVGKNVTIGGDCVIGPNVYLETGATLEDGVQIENAVVLRDRIVATRSQFKNQIVY